MLYDGQRRGVEKSMTFLLSQRSQLFHQVACCFAECEYRFFRDFSAHAAGFDQVIVKSALVERARQVVAELVGDDA